MEDVGIAMIIVLLIFVGFGVAFLFLSLIARTVAAFITGMAEGRAQRISTVNNNTFQVNNNTPRQIKSKNVAVVLAAFFGCWAWLYVFDDKENRWKFWLNLCLTLVTVGIWGIGAWIWAIVDMARKPVSYFENYAARTNQTISRSGRPGG